MLTQIKISVGIANEIMVDVEKRVLEHNLNVHDHNTTVAISLAYAYAMMIVNQWAEILEPDSFDQFAHHMKSAIDMALDSISEGLKKNIPSKNKVH